MANAFGGVYLEGDTSGTVIGKDLFGNDVIEYKRPAKKERPSVLVGTRLTKSENKQLEAIASRLCISKFQYVRDAIRQQLRDHEILFNND